MTMYLFDHHAIIHMLLNEAEVKHASYKFSMKLSVYLNQTGKPPPSISHTHCISNMQMNWSLNLNSNSDSLACSVALNFVICITCFISFI